MHCFHAIYCIDYLPTGRNITGAVAGEMTSMVEHSTSHLSEGDVRSVAAYLKTLQPAAANQQLVKLATIPGNYRFFGPVHH